MKPRGFSAIKVSTGFLVRRCTMWLVSSLARAHRSYLY
uniref:Uncharacterized protein n=1 Tax=Arundo donax TaxID=35708 RepID=A0A0A9D865_ARUDO